MSRPTTVVIALETMEEKARTKASFMAEYWSDEDAYRKVLIQEGNFYYTYMVETGKTLYDAFYIDPSSLEEEVLYDKATGRVYDKEAEIYEDLILTPYAETENETEGMTSSIWSLGILNLFFLGMFAFLLVVVLVLSIIRKS